MFITFFLGKPAAVAPCFDLILSNLSRQINKVRPGRLFSVMAHGRHPHRPGSARLGAARRGSGRRRRAASQIKPAREKAACQRRSLLPLRLSRPI